MNLYQDISRWELQRDHTHAMMTIHNTLFGKSMTTDIGRDTNTWTTESLEQGGLTSHFASVSYCYKKCAARDTDVLHQRPMQTQNAAEKINDTVIRRLQLCLNESKGFYQVNTLQGVLIILQKMRGVHQRPRRRENTGMRKWTRLLVR